MAILCFHVCSIVRFLTSFLNSLQLPEYNIPYETEGTKMFRAKVRHQFYLKKCKNDSDIIIELCAVLYPTLINTQSGGCVIYKKQNHDFVLL